MSYSFLAALFAGLVLRTGTTEAASSGMSADLATTCERPGAAPSCELSAPYRQPESASSYNWEPGRMGALVSLSSPCKSKLHVTLKLHGEIIRIDFSFQMPPHAAAFLCVS